MRKGRVIPYLGRYTFVPTPIIKQPVPAPAGRLVCCCEDIIAVSFQMFCTPLPLWEGLKLIRRQRLHIEKNLPIFVWGIAVAAGNFLISKAPDGKFPAKDMKSADLNPPLSFSRHSGPTDASCRCRSVDGPIPLPLWWKRRSV